MIQFIWNAIFKYDTKHIVNYFFYYKKIFKFIQHIVNYFFIIRKFLHSTLSVLIFFYYN